MKWKFSILFWVCYIGLEENFLLCVCLSVCVCVCVCVYVKEREKEGKRELHYASSSQTYLELYNVTLSLYKPRQALMVPGGWHSQNFSTVGTGKCQVVSPTHRSFSSPQMYSCYSFLLEAESAPVPAWGRKDSVNERFQTPSGIEPATFRRTPPRIL